MYIYAKIYGHTLLICMHPYSYFYVVPIFQSDTVPKVVTNIVFAKNVFKIKSENTV